MLKTQFYRSDCDTKFILIGRTLVIRQHLITCFEKRKVKACKATFPFSQKYYAQSVPVFSQYPLRWLMFCFTAASGAQFVSRIEQVVPAWLCLTHMVSVSRAWQHPHCVPIVSASDGPPRVRSLTVWYILDKILIGFARLHQKIYLYLEFCFKCCFN